MIATWKGSNIRTPLCLIQVHEEITQRPFNLYNKAESVPPKIRERKVTVTGLFLSGDSFAADGNVITSDTLFVTLSRAITVFVLTVLMCLISGAIATRKLRSADPAHVF